MGHAVSKVYRLSIDCFPDKLSFLHDKMHSRSQAVVPEEVRLMGLPAFLRKALPELFP